MSLPPTANGAQEPTPSSEESLDEQVDWPGCGTLTPLALPEYLSLEESFTGSSASSYFDFRVSNDHVPLTLGVS
jgi:hypothetical protein